MLRHPRGGVGHRPVSVLGWLVGAVALGMGYSAAQRPVSKKRGRIAMVLGFAAILIGLFFYTLTIAMQR